MKNIFIVNNNKINLNHYIRAKSKIKIKNIYNDNDIIKNNKMNSLYEYIDEYIDKKIINQNNINLINNIQGSQLSINIDLLNDIRNYIVKQRGTELVESIINEEIIIEKLEKEIIELKRMKNELIELEEKL